MQSGTEGAVWLLGLPALPFISQSHVLPAIPTLGCRLWNLAERNCGSSLCSLCSYSLWVVLSLRWQIPDHPQGRTEAECCAICH